MSIVRAVPPRAFLPGAVPGFSPSRRNRKGKKTFAVCLFVQILGISGWINFVVNGAIGYTHTHKQQRCRNSSMVSLERQAGPNVSSTLRNKPESFRSRSRGLI